MSDIEKSREDLMTKYNLNDKGKDILEGYDNDRNELAKFLFHLPIMFVALESFICFMTNPQVLGSLLIGDLEFSTFFITTLGIVRYAFCIICGVRLLYMFINN